MNRDGHRLWVSRAAGSLAVSGIALALVVASNRALAAEIRVNGSGLSLGGHSTIQDGPDRMMFSLRDSHGKQRFVQSAIKHSTSPALLGPTASKPHFTVRYALPIPPDNATNISGTLTGLDPEVWPHNHSPGFEALPNGDLLAVYFSARTSAGANESDRTTRFVQARLRHGAEQWDPPELFLDFEAMNDQSALLWTEGSTVRFFGGGRNAPDSMPFKMAVSTNNGVTWSVSLPQLDKPTADYTAQPIANAFRGGDGALYLAMDGGKDTSFLWRSPDNGVHWSDTGGRTGARHSTIIPLDDHGTFLSIGGKNAGINGWTPMNLSSNWGSTWSGSTASPFPALGGNQRPSLIRLANGHLLLVTDSYHRNTKKSPEGWKQGEGCFVAVSKDNGTTWHFKKLPVTLVHEKDQVLGTLGYATVRQSPNGLIHVLTTMTHPCLHYEFNEAWIFSEAGDIPPENDGGTLRTFQETYADGSLRLKWRARVCTDGRYLLDGSEVSYHSNGQKEREVTYSRGHKTGRETFWNSDGTKRWSWHHNPKKNSATWTHYWPNGKPKVQSQWTTKSQARDSTRNFLGLVAHGPARHWDEAGRLIHTHYFANGLLKTDGQKGAAPNDAR